MTDRLDQLLADRLNALAAPADDADWLDVVRRSRRVSPARGPGRGRRALVIAAGFTLLLALAAAAGALTNTQTGVSAIDRLLDKAFSPPSSKDTALPPGAKEPAPVPDFELEPGTPQVQLRAAAPGGVEWVLLAFQNRDGLFCEAAAPDTEAVRPLGGVGCVNRNNLGVRLRHGALASITRISDSHVLVSGLTSADATHVLLRSEQERRVAKLSETWVETRFSRRFAPRLPDGSPRTGPVGLKAFVAIVSADKPPELPPRKLRRWLLGRPRVRVVTTLSDGRRLVAGPTLGGA